LANHAHRTDSLHSQHMCAVGQMPDGHPIPDSEVEMNHSLKENFPSGTCPTEAINLAKASYDF